jgi:hypothetical protein
LHPFEKLFQKLYHWWGFSDPYTTIVDLWECQELLTWSITYLIQCKRQFATNTFTFAWFNAHCIYNLYRQCERTHWTCTRYVIIRDACALHASNVTRMCLTLLSPSETNICYYCEILEWNIHIYLLYYLIIALDWNIVHTSNLF